MRRFLKSCILTGSGLCISPCMCSAEEKLPNIVLILADDMGIGDINCYYEQPQIATPHIDELASHGLQFMQHYSGSTVSAPSRCCLLTGKHTGHAFIRGNKGVRIAGEAFDYPLAAEEVTVAEILKEKGYATMCVGKWGLGGPGTEGSPLNQGFDYFFGYLSQEAAHRYYPASLYENETKVHLGGRVYSHWMIMEKGLDFIRRQKGKPYFAYFAITPPHADLDYPDMSQYCGLFPEKPYVNKNGKGGFKTQMTPKAAYAAMVSEVDRSVGAIISLLKEKGEWENTILIFSSDNGVHCVGGHDPDFFNSNGPFRGYKRDLYEGGVRTPFLVSWPAHIKEHRKTTHISAFWDFLPTVCDIIGVRTPQDIDGISYLPTLMGDLNHQEKHTYIYYEFFEQGGKQSILKDGWKLIRLNVLKGMMKKELYYLPNDIGEERNLISQNPAKAEELELWMKEARTQSTVYNGY